MSFHERGSLCVCVRLGTVLARKTWLHHQNNLDQSFTHQRFAQASEMGQLEDDANAKNTSQNHIPEIDITHLSFDVHLWHRQLWLDHLRHSVSVTKAFAAFSWIMGECGPLATSQCNVETKGIIYLSCLVVVSRIRKYCPTMLHTQRAFRIVFGFFGFFVFVLPSPALTSRQTTKKSPVCVVCVVRIRETWRCYRRCKGPNRRFLPLLLSFRFCAWRILIRKKGTLLPLSPTPKISQNSQDHALRACHLPELATIGTQVCCFCSLFISQVIWAICHKLSHRLESVQWDMYWKKAIAACRTTYSVSLRVVNRHFVCKASKSSKDAR